MTWAHTGRNNVGPHPYANNDIHVSLYRQSACGYDKRMLHACLSMLMCRHHGHAVETRVDAAAQQTESGQGEKAQGKPRCAQHPQFDSWNIDVSIHAHVRSEHKPSCDYHNECNHTPNNCMTVGKADILFAHTHQMTTLS